MIRQSREASGSVACAVLMAVIATAWALRTAAVHAQGQTITCSTGFTTVVAPAGAPAFVPLTSLKAVPNPVLPKDAVTGKPTLRADLGEYVANLTAALQLGKALFWDMQAGSDNKTACATCHFHAGADARLKNQLNPSADGSWNGYGPNYTFDSFGFDFPLASDNAAASQGVRRSLYKGLTRSGAESTSTLADPVFSVGGKNVRQATGLNTPSAVNAVFNHRNFFNGRAQAEFNGVNPFGSRDAAARVWSLDARGNPVAVDIHISNASLASQAVGPALNAVEMSADGRSFLDVAKKLYALKPLGLQAVAASDSVLGPVADTSTGKGLKVTYKTLVQTAFQPKWWNSKKTVSVNGVSASMSEANFSLFWGLSIMLYEATLVSDETPIDRYVASRTFDAAGKLVSHDPALLDAVVAQLQGHLSTLTRERLLNGLDLFEKPVAPLVNGAFQAPPPAGSGVGCSLCHVGAETTSASVQNLAGVGLEPGDTAFKNAGFDLRLERMFMAIPPVTDGTTSIYFDPPTFTVIEQTGVVARVSVYDAGWYNIGVRPTVENPGLDAADPFGNSLSWTRLFQALPNPGIVKVPGGGLGCPTSPPAAPATSPFAGEVLNPTTGLPLLTGPLTASEPSDVAGSFKTPSLRNVELTGPYFHNGGKSTLLQAIELYDGGGDFANPTKSPLLRPLGMTQEQHEDLVAFLLALTDERVRWQRAPFDHPQLWVPEGDDPVGTDVMREIPAVGAAGSQAPLPRFLNLNPFK
jgi:cytochrome c peroxidase